MSKKKPKIQLGMADGESLDPLEVHPNAKARFERAVDAAAKTGPMPRAAAKNTNLPKNIGAKTLNNEQ